MSNDTMLEEAEYSITPNKPKIVKEVRANVERVTRNDEKALVDLDRAQKNLVNVYMKEEKYPVRVAPSYARYFGRVMRVAINGIIVAVKCDGTTVNLPESFATEVYRRMAEVDKYENHQNRMADVTRNFETSPGQLNFFG